MFIVDVYFVIDSVRKLLDIPSYTIRSLEGVVKPGNKYQYAHAPCNAAVKKRSGYIPHTETVR
jgi:hypothetical protein